MVCKLRLKFRKPAKHTFRPRLQPAPLHSEAGKEAFQLSLQGLLATHHHIPIGDVEHSWGALKGSLNITAQAQLKQPRGPQKPASPATPSSRESGLEIRQSQLVGAVLGVC